ncbi:MAG TPA: SDR family oxidoreductase [Pyrinomonadaceae bacterium]|nr:SDR family oxidoreductase [Pyrinomonadaceae bacterium]
MRTLKQLMDLQNRVALITGGAGHIGRVIGESLSELGASIAVLDIDQTAADTVAGEIAQSYNVKTLPLAVDLNDISAVKSAPEKVLKEFGRLDVLIHSAAYGGDTKFPGWAVPFAEQTTEAWDRALRVNLTSAFALAQAARQPLTDSGHGSILLISSIYGLAGPDMSLYEGTAMANPAGYGASKGGLLQLMRYLATVLAPHVRVNAISPGGVWREQPEQFHDRYSKRTPLGRMATEEDLKGAAAYLASDLSSYVTGHNLVVDGGWTTW